MLLKFTISAILKLLIDLYNLLIESFSEVFSDLIIAPRSYLAFYKSVLNSLTGIWEPHAK